ncbi:MAG: DUF359 domain-containing protein [Hadesarchaea archaeon]|nr:MAG: DUF359 domain-containing protein [Hadesarchaea archaeon]
MRPLLKRPLGQLFSSVTTAIERLQQLRPTRLIAVGDIVTAELLEAGLKLDVAVVDFVVMRSPVDKKIRRTIDLFDAKIVRVKNPAGTITQELRAVLDEAKPPLKIIVDGEEDLATLPAVLSAPLGSVVVYGQPYEGVVIVEVTESKRREFEALLEQFRTSR